MKTFIQFVNETIQSPAEKPTKNPPRKIAGHTFAEEQIGDSDLETAAPPKTAPRMNACVA